MKTTQLSLTQKNPTIEELIQEFSDVFLKVEAAILSNPEIVFHYI